MLSSAKFQHKIKDLLAVDLVSKPAHVELAKHLGGTPHEAVELDAEQDAGSAGIMLYTSGTTNRPVSDSLVPVSLVTLGTIPRACEPCYPRSTTLTFLLPYRKAC